MSTERFQTPSIFVPSGSGGLNEPSELICRDGYLYVSSQNNDRILRYDGATGDFVDTFVDTHSGGLDTPVGLDFGPDGRLYVARFNNELVLAYDDSTGTPTGAVAGA